MNTTPSFKCSCGKCDLYRGIRQDRVGPKHWKIHDYGECYEVINTKRRSLPKYQNLRTLTASAA